MSASDLHLVIRADKCDGATTYTLERISSWQGAQAIWKRLDDKRLATWSKGSKQAPADYFYFVRSLDDPQWSHLAPKLYASPEGAAKALAHRLDPHGRGARPRFHLLDLLDMRTGRDGWSNVASRLEQQGYLVRVRTSAFEMGRAYLTPTALALTPRSPMQIGW